VKEVEPAPKQLDPRHNSGPDVGILQAGQATHDPLVTREDVGQGVRVEQLH